MLQSLKSLLRGSWSNKRRAAPSRPRRGGRKSATSLASRITAAGDRMAFSWAVRETLYRHVSTQNRNGVPIEISLEKFRARLQRRGKLSSDKIVEDVARRMRDGSTLADALVKWIPPEEVSIIASGELSGNLPRSLDLVIESNRRIDRVNKALKSAATRPIIYAVAMYVTLWFIGRYVVPDLQQALSRERAQGLAAGLYAAGDFANSMWAFLPPVLVYLIVKVIIYSFPKWTGPYRIAAERHFPYSFYRDTQGYTWLMGFTSLLRAGLADVEILKRQLQLASPWLKERLHALWWRMDNGASLSNALMAKGKNKMPPFGFPNPDIVDDISSMDGFADFPERLSAVAIQWAEDIEASTLKLANVLGVAMEMLMYLIMGLLMVSINSLSAQMGTGPGF